MSSDLRSVKIERLKQLYVDRAVTHQQYKAAQGIHLAGKKEYWPYKSALAQAEGHFKAIIEEISSLEADVTELETDTFQRQQDELTVQRDHEREMKIIDHEIARENRLAAEATAKVAATAQEQASQSLDGLLKGLQGNGEG